MTDWMRCLLVAFLFGAAYATSLLADRIRKRKMGNFARGIFTLVVGSIFFLGFLLVALAPCVFFARPCPDL